MRAAQTLADVAAAYLLNAQARADLNDSTDRSHERALHDPLTGLPNRLLLLERLDHAVLRSRRSGMAAAVLFADLDQFKIVNDLHGHRIGDELLIAVAQRLTATLRPGDTLARLSGDEFVILCEDLAGPAEVDTIAARVCDAVAAPFALSSGKVEITVSVGIAFSGRGDELSEQLLHAADTAMYQAKRKGGASHQIVDLREQHLTAVRAGLERDLHHALAREELRTEYQPIVDTTDGRIIGVEALLRWDHPSRGSVAPTLLVPLAEQSQLITQIGRWVLEQACTDWHRWQDRDQTRELTISVNVSPHQLLSPDFVTIAGSVLSDTDTAPERVTLDLTESVFIQDDERALVVLNELKAVGVKIALDDFGPGNSSLNYLTRYPIDVVKIDQGFVAELEDNPSIHAIVSKVIELAHLLGKTVVAEGVETAEQHLLLAALGCDHCQGFYFAHPMAADALEILTNDHTGGGTVLPALAVGANV
jgi:diguanylate cyclase (GGDEF)-like protein